MDRRYVRHFSGPRQGLTYRRSPADLRGGAFLGARRLLREDRHEDDRHADDEGRPAQARGEAGEHRDGRKDGHADLKGGEADVGHAVLVERAGLELRIDDLEQGDTGGDGRGGPAPGEDATLEPLLAEGLRREHEGDERAVHDAEDEEDEQRHPVVGDGGGHDRRDTEGDEVVGRGSGHGVDGVLVQEVLAAEAGEEGASQQADDERHGEQRDGHVREDAGDEAVDQVGDAHGEHDEAEVQGQRFDGGGVRRRLTDRRALLDVVDVAGAQVPRQFAGHGGGAAGADAPVGEDEATDDGGQGAHGGGGEAQGAGGDGASLLEGVADGGGGAEAADEADGQHHAEPVLGAEERLEQEDTEEDEQTPLAQEHAGGVRPHLAGTGAHGGGEVLPYAIDAKTKAMRMPV